MPVQISTLNDSAHAESRSWEVEASTQTYSAEAFGYSEYETSVSNPSYTLDVVGGVSDVPSYDGEYEFSPGEETQTVSSGGYFLAKDITINPIPSNYGRIAWDGNAITVY